MTDSPERCSAGNDELIQHLQCYENGDHLVHLKAEQIDRIIEALSAPPQRLQDMAAALRLLMAEDERQSKLHELLETIREQIRTGIEPEHRPEGLFKNIQDAVYAMRGRTRLMDDAAITHVFDTSPLTRPQSEGK
ncbi:hypothetical protein [Bradyrhizobium sp.]|jgi:hypothetical protein|uniref:hypothetical protein n=1 Tax=Bradyrhizobium sp. TaxID=376 RepID=UPI002DDD0776|nr:hypothetical protein [Bradyrhizobium sp.]HEV2155434.1 hypothetical protein [Bradyrhizobium sp.]